MITFSTAVRSALLASLVTLAACSNMPMMGSSDTMSMKDTLTGAQEVPPVVTAGTGTIVTAFDKSTNVLTWTVTYSGLSGPVTAAHFHGPAAAGANAGVAVGFSGDLGSPISGKATLTPAQAEDMAAGKWYVNLHIAKNPGGEIRGQITGK